MKKSRRKLQFSGGHCNFPTEEIVVLRISIFSLNFRRMGCSLFSPRFSILDENFPTGRRFFDSPKFRAPALPRCDCRTLSVVSKVGSWTVHCCGCFATDHRARVGLRVWEWSWPCSRSSYDAVDRRCECASSCTETTVQAKRAARLAKQRL